MGGHNVIIVDFNNLFTGDQNFLRRRLEGSRRLDFAFGGLEELKSEVAGLTVVPIWDHMFGKRNRDLRSLSIDDPRKIYMVPESLDGKVKADHFVLKLAEELDAYILSRDGFQTEQAEGYTVDSEKIVAPIYIEKQERWMFVMKNEYRALLRSPFYRESIYFAGVEVHGDEAVSTEDVLVRALRSKHAQVFVDYLEQLPRFHQVAIEAEFDSSFDRDVRDRAFNIHLPLIEESFKERFLEAGPLRQSPFVGLADRFRRKREVVQVPQSVEVQHEEIQSNPVEETPRIRKRAEPHFRFFGDEVGELRRRLGRRVAVTAFMRRVDNTLKIGWLDPSTYVPLRNVETFPDEPMPIFVEVRGRVCEIDGVVSIEVNNPMQYRHVGFNEVLELSKPKSNGVGIRVSWVLPRFPWTGRFESVPAKPVTVVKPKVREGGIPKVLVGPAVRSGESEDLVPAPPGAPQTPEAERSGIARRIVPVLFCVVLGIVAVIVVVL